jgi:hypothetical protein
MAIFSDLVGRGVLASRPSAGELGRLYIATDDTPPTMYRDNGTTWDAVADLSGSGGGGGGGGGGYTIPIVPPPTSGWSWVNQGPATATAVEDGLVLEDPTPHGGESARLYVRSLTIPFTVKALVVPDMYPGNYVMGGICVRDSSSGAFVSPSIQVSGSSALHAFSWSGTGSVGSDLGSMGWPWAPVWFRVMDDGTTFSVSWSLDGRRWIDLYSGAHAAVITPNQAGIMVNSNSNVAAVSIPSFEIT